ncbi:hypothetical protein WJX73_007769 [Symbiochloris irregularis]|uniref:Uncharacterized protein n=1 Tax=Symbiochloris irregularis TaxID=706552 RepID=A0AAW1PVV3_9CHLO
MAGLKQQNKPHKPGRRAGARARQSHKVAKEARKSAAGPAHKGAAGRQQRHNTAKQIRDAKRAELLAHHRSQTAPAVVAILPLSQDVDSGMLWNALLSASMPNNNATLAEASGEAEMKDALGASVHPWAPTEVVVQGPPKQRLTLLPPLIGNVDAMSIVDIGRAADVIILAMPCHDTDAATKHIDPTGLASMAVLRSLGLPTLVAVATVGPSASLKDRAQAKKTVAAALDVEVPGDHKGARISDESSADESSRTCCLHLRGYIRGTALSANQLIHVPTAGDYQISHISSANPPAAHNSDRHTQTHKRKRAADGADEASREGLEREHQGDNLAGEQTWPTQEELAEAATSQADSSHRRRLPKGTSEYQAAWILDDGGDDEEEYEEVDDQPDSTHPSKAASHAFSEMGDGDAEMGDDEDGDEGSEVDVGSSDVGMNAQEAKRRWGAQQEDAHFPDEVDTPTDMPARQRFAKYRGLKSWRTSPWDPMESLPRHYSRVFALQYPKRAHARANALQAEAAHNASGVPSGVYVEVCIVNVPCTAAVRVLARTEAFLKGTAAPLVARGLLQHEAKLSVLNFSLRKASTYQAPVANKAQLVLCTGLRTWEGKGVLSSDEPGSDKHKMERYLHPGRQCMLSIIAPISYGPLPLLVFLRDEAGNLQLAASGSLRSCNPNRPVLKKIVLSGYPVRVHKVKGVVRWMFHTAEDVRWFRPLGLWTKRGRHGHIREPVGTHGAMKCIFDAPLSQQDVVCASLYKRVFPQWPQELLDKEAWL